MKKFLFLFLLFLRATVFSQAPNISYGTPPVFSSGIAITPLAPTNSGGALSSPNVKTWAGSYTNKGLTNGNLATATFNNPQGMTFDSGGNMYVADYSNNAIRKISSSGEVSTFVTTQIPKPTDIAIDKNGNLFVCFENSSVIFKYTPQGAGTSFYHSTSSANTISAKGIVIDNLGNVFISDASRAIVKITPDGVYSVFTSNFGNISEMYGIAIDANENLYVACRKLDTDPNIPASVFPVGLIFKITPSANVSVCAGGTSGDLDGIGTAAQFNGAVAIVADNNNNIYFSDESNSGKIRKINLNGNVVSTITGFSYGYQDGALHTAKIISSNKLSVDNIGNVYVTMNSSFANGGIRKVTLNSGYSINPNLPSGLIINDSTGVISGTPTVLSPVTTYTVTATNTSGTSSHAMAMSVVCSNSSTTTKTIVASFLPYTWHGLIFSTAGTQTIHLTNHLGCDSAATLILSLAPTAAALNFDGVNDYVELPATINNQITSNHITLEGWFNLGTTSSSNPNLIGEAFLGDGKIKFMIYKNSSGINAGFFDGSWHQVTVALPPSGWNHIAATYDQQNIKLYYNGVLKGSLATTLALPAGTEKWLLNSSWDMGANNFIPASMDEVRIWNRALTQCELYEHMHCELTGTQSGLVAYYQFNEGVVSDLGNNATTTSLTDASGNNYNGTLYNFALTGTTSNWILPGAITSGVSCAATNTYASTSNLAIYASQYPYSWNGLTFTTASTKTATLATAYGCDSLATLVLTTKADVVAAGLNFDGVDDYVELPATINNQITSNHITVEGWFNLGTTSSSYPTLIGEAFLGDGKIKFDLYKNSGGINAGFFDGSWHQVTVALPASGWNHIAATYDQQNIKIYYNGVLQGSFATTLALPAGTEKWTLNSNWDVGANNHIPASMDEVRIWNRALTQCELLAHMHCELTGTQTGLVAYYTFNQGTDLGNNGSFTSLTDASGNNFNGTLHNFGLIGTASNWILPAAVTSGISCGAVPTYSSSNSLAVYAAQYPYTWNGVTFTTPGTKTATVATALGCDSLATLVLTTKPDAAAAGLQFDGVNDYVELPATINNQITSNHISVEGWFNLGTASNSGGNPNLIGEAFLGDGKIKFMMYKNSSGINAGFYDGSWHQVTVALPPSGWNHIAATYDQQTIKLYYNGVLEGSLATTLALPAGTEKWLLNSNWGMGAGDFISASMDEVRIWNKALDHCDILRHYNRELIGTETGLVAYYKFNQGMDWGINTAITSLTDASGNNYNGTLHNFTLTGGTSNWTLPGGVTTGVSYVPILTTNDIITLVPNQLPYHWNGLTFTAAGTQTATFTNVAGCDSAILTLTVKVPPVISYAASAHTFYKGTAISAVNPTNTGGAPTPELGSGTSTFAGTGLSGSADGTGTAASFKYPRAVTLDRVGNVYVADCNNNTIRKITPAGVVTTLAGSGAFGSTNATGTTASFNRPSGITVDKSGNVYVADYDNNTIRKITAAGVVSTFAGNGSTGAQDGVAASFYHPTGVVFDTINNNIYVADNGNNKIRKISGGVVTTFVGSGSSGSADGTGTAATFSNVRGITVDANHNLYVTDGNKIRKITSAGVVTTIAGSSTASSVDGIGTAATFFSANGITIDASDNLYVAEEYGFKIRKITPAGVVTTFAGTGGAGATDGIAATFYIPAGVVSDGTASKLYVADLQNQLIRKIEQVAVGYPYYITPALPAGLSMHDGIITGTPTVTSANKTYTVSTSNADGVSTTTINIEVLARAPIINYSPTAHTFYKGTAISTLTPTNTGGVVPATVKGRTTIFAGSTSGASGTTNATGTAARFNMPSNIAKDASGNLFVSDLNYHVIRKITPTGVVSTFVGHGTPFFTPGNGTDASFGNPSGLVFDASGNLFVASQYANQIFKITPSGDVSLLAGQGQGYVDGVGTAAQFNHPSGLTINSTGDLFVVDSYNNRIRKITPDGTVTTFAGSTEGFANGTGTAAQFRVPSDIVADASDNLIVTDYYNHKLRKITPLGVVTTFAGSTQGQAMGTGTSAQFNYPIGIARDNNNFYISQSFYGILKMNAATEVTHFAGNTSTGNVEGIGDAARFNSPNGLAFDASIGVLYVADLSNNNIKKVEAYDAYTISPALPAGLSMDITTGVITGNPTALSSNSNYTITATNEGGSYSTTVQIEVLARAPIISYSPTAHTFYTGTAISSLIPTNTGGVVLETVKGRTTIFAGSTSGVAGTTNATGTAARFNGPSNFAKDAHGNIYVSDLTNNLIRKITSSGIVTTFVGNGTTLTTPGNGTSASIGHPSGLVFDASGNLFVAAQYTHQICKITPSGDLSIFAGSTSGYHDGVGTAAKFNHPSGLTINSTGHLFVADSYSHRIRMIAPDGTVTTLAGSLRGFADGTGTAAEFNLPSDIVADASDNIIVTDYSNHRLRKITPLGVVTTLAGSTQGQAMGTGTSAQFNYPVGIALDNHNFYIAQSNYGILKMNVATEVTHLAGNTSIGNVEGIGDAARFNAPNGLAFDASIGVLYVADLSSNNIKKVEAYDAYTISPALPAGLSMDIATGVITGIPTVFSANTTYTITATNEGGSNSTTLQLEVIVSAPIISSFTPTTAGTGSVVTITGTNLTGATSVHFGGTAATSFTDVSATSITAVVASGATGIVSVTTPGGTATLAGFTYFTTLPLVWLDFTATAKTASGKATEVLLNWKTANELNAKDFVVQRKANTGNWTDLGIVNALPSGISVAQYDFTDKMPSIGSNFYRLLHRDLDGQSNYSKVVNISISETAAMQIFPNPVNQGVLNIQLPIASMVTLFNTDGQMVWKQQLSAGTHPIRVSQFAKGMYLLFANGVSKKVIIE